MIGEVRMAIRFESSGYDTFEASLASINAALARIGHVPEPLAPIEWEGDRITFRGAVVCHQLITTRTEGDGTTICAAVLPGPGLGLIVEDVIGAIGAHLTDLSWSPEGWPMLGFDGPEVR